MPFFFIVLDWSFLFLSFPFFFFFFFFCSCNCSYLQPINFPSHTTTKGRPRSTSKPGMACSRCDTGRGVSLVVLILTLIVANAAMGSDPSICAAHGPRAGRALVCVIFIAVLWAAELVPLTVTSLLPIVVFPFANVLSGRDTARLYFNNTQFVLVGTSLVAVALERCDLHRHFALRVVRAVGTSPRRLILAFMV